MSFSSSSSSNYYSSSSSLVYSVSSSLNHKDSIRDSNHAKSTKTDYSFLTNHLTLPPSDVSWSEQEDNELLEQIQAATVEEKDINDPLCKLLTRYSKRIYKSLPMPLKKPSNAYVFLDFHSHSPTHHPYNPQNAPNILCVKGPLKGWSKPNLNGGKDPQKVPHYRVVSIVDVKTRSTIRGRMQLASHVYQLLKARPDLPGAYVAWGSPRGYQILWSDASGVVASKFTPWTNVRLLGAYVYSLYRPPSSHYLRDRSIRPMKTKFQPEDEVLWKIKVKEHGRSFPRCKSIFVGNSWGRRTNIFKYQHASETVVIKDSYRDTKEIYVEEKLLYKIHKYGVYPGVARPFFARPSSTGQGRLKEEPLPVDLPRTARLDGKYSSERVTERVKARLVMGSYGESLGEARSVLDILKVFYDAIEVHRGLVTERKVLHRDISFDNILIYPVHNPEAMSGKALTSNPPFFIDDLLKRTGEKSSKDASRALLIDFDFGAKYNPAKKDKEAEEELNALTGTPMYIARSVASGLLLEPGCAPYPQMPLLSLRAQKYYFMAYAKKEYLDRNDKKDTCHGYVIPAESKDSNILGSGDVLDSDDILTGDNDADGNSAQAKNRGRDIGGLSDAAEPSFHHRPDHDVESFFWVLLATLLQAQPKYSEDDTHLADYWDAYDMFSRHSIQDGRENDSRTELLSYRERQFKHALHPKLHNLAPMLSEMAKQVAPEYGYMDPPPALDHLHEAMRRLLLEQIVQMEHAHNPIELLPGYMRPLKDPKEGDSQPASSRGNKRKSGTDWEKNSSKRVKYGYGANYRGPPDVDTYWRNLNSLPWSRPRYLPV